MNQFRRTTLCSLFAIGLFAGACNNTQSRHADEEASVLLKPPYAAITDSIRQSSANSASGSYALAAMYFRRAELLARNNQHELAAVDYKKSWTTTPDEMTGLRYAATLNIIGQTREAEELLKDCRKRFPKNGNFSAMLGDLYQQAGAIEQAQAIYDDMLKTDTTNFEAWYEKGLLYEKARDTAAAINALRKAYTLQPISTYALELAHIYAEKGNAEALQLTDLVLSKDQNHELIDPFFIKGIYYSNIKAYPKAIIQFDSCIARDWKFTDAYLEKGIVLFHQNKYQEALGIFQMSVKVSNTYPDGYFWIGRVYEATGQKDDARLFYERALALDKDFKEAAEGIKRLK